MELRILDMRLFRGSGVEIFEEDIQFLRNNEMLFISRGEEFDETSNFALYKKSRDLGEGGFGKVYEAKNRLTKEKVAIKMIDYSKIKNAKEIEMIFKEISALKILKHKNILKIITCYNI